MRKRPLSDWKLWALLLFCLVLFPWSDRVSLPADEGSRKNDLKQIETPEARLNRALARPARFEFVEAPLTDVLEYLKDEYQIPITLDKRGLENEGIDSATPITMNLSGVSLRAGLESILEPLGLAWAVRKEMLTISTQVRIDEWLETRIYDVRDLLLSDGEPFVDESSYDYDSLYEVLLLCLPLQNFDDGQVGGFAEFHGMIVVSQPQYVLREIEQILQQLRQVRRQQQAMAAQRSTGDSPSADPWLVRVYPLPRLEPEGERLENSSQGSALSKPAGDSGVAEIVRSAQAKAQSSYSKELVGLLPRMIAPESWSKSPAEIRSVANTLVVNQRLSVHRKLKRLLDRLDSVSMSQRNLFLEDARSFVGGGFFQIPVGAVAAPAQDQAPRVVAAVAPAAEQPQPALRIQAAPWARVATTTRPATELTRRRKTELAIRQALGRPAALEVLETPLEEVLAFLSKRYAVPIVLDYPSLENDGVDPHVPVTSDVSNVRLSNLLDLTLDGLNCGWLIRDQAVVVTSQSVARSTLLTRAYPVGEMLKRDGESFPPHDADVASLEHLVRSSVDPESWHPRGGMADLAVVDDVLLVSQSHASHEEIERLLADVSRRQNARPRTTHAADPLAMSVRTYSLAQLDPAGMNLNLAASPGWVLNNLQWGEEAAPEGVPSSAQRLHAARLDAGRYDRLLERRLAFAQQLALALPELVAPRSWKSGGGLGEAAGLPGVLVVLQSSAVHAQLREQFRKWEHDLNPFADERALGGGFFFQIAAQAQQQAAPETPKAVEGTGPALSPPAANPAVNPGAEAELPTTRRNAAAQARLKGLLEKKAGFKLEEKPLAEVLELLESKHGLPLKMDEREIQDHGLSLDVTVSLDLSDAAIESVLEQILEPLQLDWYFRDETLWITSASSTKVLVRKLYPVRDLLLHDPQRDVEADSRPMAELLMMSVAQTSWQVTGGQASVKGLADMLVVSQSRRGHQQVARFLEDLRRARRSEPGKYEVPLDDPLLSKSVKLEVKGMPLSRVAVRLAEMAGVPVALDRKGFETAGLDPDQAVTMRASDLELRSLLNLMLEPLGLSWQLKGKLILIQPRMMAPHETRIYNVRHLLRPRADGRDYDYDALCEALRSTVAAGEWNEGGGQGSLNRFQGLLIVSHEPRVHTEIRELLEEIARLTDKQRAEAGLPPAVVRELDAVRARPDDEQPMTVVLYPLTRTAQNNPESQVQTLLNQLQAQLQGQAPPDAKTAIALVEQLLKALEIEQQKSTTESEKVAKTTKTLVEILPVSIAPKSWKAAGGAGQVHALPDAIIVRQNAEGHTQVRALLEKMGFDPALGEQIGPFAR